MKLALLCVFASGCLALDDIPLDQCGNHVVEDSEDCDLADPEGSIDTCDECTWRCVPPTTGGMCADAWRYEPGRGTCCPDGYACGDDLLCHAPSGLFREVVSARELPVDRIVLAELDGDQTHEIVGLSDSAVEVIRLAPDGTIDSEQNVPVGGATRWAVGNLEGPDDGTDEVVAAFADGLIAFGAPQGELETFPFTSFVVADPLVQTDRKSRVALVPGFSPAPIIIASRIDDSCTTGDGVCAMVMTADQNSPQPAVLPCGIGRFGAEHVIGDRVPVRALAGVDNLVAIGLRDGAGSAACVYPVTMEPVVPPYITLGAPTVLDLPAGTDLGTGDLVFVRPTVAGCPSLVVPLEESGAFPMLGIAAGSASAPCTIQPTVRLVQQGESIVPIAAGQIFGSAGEELVTNYGVGTLTPLATPGDYSVTVDFGAPRAWRSAALGDINRDGLIDVVAAAYPDPLSDGDDVDVMRQRPLADGGGFAYSRILTADPIARVRTADLDGDLYDDIVYVEGTEVNVAFGAPSGGPPVVVRASTFDQINDVLEDPTGFDDDGVADIVVATPSGGTVLYGSFTRQLVAPLLLGEPGEGVSVTDVAIGDIDGANGPDLAALAYGQGTIGVVLALATPTRGFFTPAGSAINVPELLEVVVDRGAFVAVDFVDPGTLIRRPVFLGVSHGNASTRSRVTAYVAGFDGTTAFFAPFGAADVVTDAANAPWEVEEVHVTDLEGDGSPEILIDYAHRGPSGGRTTWYVGLQLGEFAMTFTPAELASPGGACGTSAAIDLDRAQPGDELVGGCAAGLVALASGMLISDAITEVDQLVAGDVTGDGVDDLVVLAEPDALHGELTVFVQCPTRDPGPCTAIGGMK